MDDLSAIPVLRRLSASETDGRLKRRADDAIAALRDSAKKPAEIKEIRSDLDDVVKESKSLRERLEAVEKKDSAKKSTRTKKKKGTSK